LRAPVGTKVALKRSTLAVVVSVSDVL